MEMDTLIIPNILLVLEMFFINTYATLACSKRKRSTIEIWFYMVLFSLLIFASIWFTTPEITGYTLQRSYRMLSIAGLIYLLPLHFLVKQPFRHTLIIFNTFWVYSLIVFAVSYRISNLVFTNTTEWSSLGIQTLLYLASLPYILKFMQQKMVFIIGNIKGKTQSVLIMLTFSLILLIYAIKYSFENGSNLFIEIMILLLIGFCFAITFQLAFSFIDAARSVEVLGLKSKTDPLTRLRNREAMLEDAYNRINSQKPFSVIFLDLDNFKSVNDSFGHAVGDDYLVSFANSARRLLDIKDKMYRISGDEFLVLKDGASCEKSCREFEKMRFLNNPSGIEFLGLSTGCSSYPADSKNISELLGIADSRMYQNKKMKHKTTDDAKIEELIDAVE